LVACFRACNILTLKKKHSALAHYLYEHTHSEVTLAHVASFTSNQINDTPTTKATILAQAPHGCRALLISNPVRGEDGTVLFQHYKARLLVQDHWYDCESIAYKNTRMIRRVNDNDWTATALCGSVVYSLAKLDAFTAGHTLITPPLESFINYPANTLEWVDGRTITTSTQTVRRVHEAWHMLNGTTADATAQAAIEQGISVPDDLTSKRTHPAQPSPQRFPDVGHKRLAQSETEASTKPSKKAMQHQHQQPYKRTKNPLCNKTNVASAHDKTRSAPIKGRKTQAKQTMKQPTLHECFKRQQVLQPTPDFEHPQTLEQP